jgi:hypothetical protein
MSWRMQEIVESHPIALAPLGPHLTRMRKVVEEAAEDSSASKLPRQGTTRPARRTSALQVTAEEPHAPVVLPSYC